MWKHIFALISAVLLRVLGFEWKTEPGSLRPPGNIQKAVGGSAESRGVRLGCQSRLRSRVRLDHGDPALCEDVLSATRLELSPRAEGRR